MTKYIAEIGLNHGGDLNKAKALVDAFANADIIKTQWCRPERVYTSFDMVDLFAKNMLSMDDMILLASYVRDKYNLPFLVTYNCIEDLEEMDRALSIYSTGIPQFKIASEDVTNLYFLEQIRDYVSGFGGWEIILSTGMSTLDEVRKAVEILKPDYKKNQSLVLMYCVSQYPTYPRWIDLHWMGELYDTFGYPVGLSDHTDCIGPSIMAAGMGAEYIERHVVWDRSGDDIDKVSSIDPNQFNVMMEEGNNAQIGFFSDQLEFANSYDLKKREEILRTKRWYKE